MFKGFAVLGFKNFFKNAAESAVVDLGDRVLGGEPQILLGRQRIIEAGACKGGNGAVLVVLPHQNAAAFKVIDRLTRFLTGFVRENQLGFALRDAQLARAVDVAIGVTGDGNGLFPVAHDRTNAIDQNRRTEHRAVQRGANRAVWAFPHAVKLILRHTLLVRRDGRALDAHAVLLDRLCGLQRDLIGRAIALGKTKVKIDRFEIDIRL